ncbi:Hsp70 family protein [Actinoplanes sp. NEAU-A12]|uniref:Hsp70 family protein n=1 Tax=Actinoplanes sandaracinus TaxID=3045177 RepID=A0ABT6WDF1_9ACTN|nr:Hsp70 family protein [Actinoplanes sandaracinus]MDI6097755.1 Hsp70 family protein [Actinoplanes sandaracinus]
MPIDQGGPKRYALGVDFGTSNTVAVARWPDGRARPILVDGSPLLPSAVFADSSGNLLVGRDAVHSARIDPARFEPNPKRRVDDDLVLLGEREFETVELIAAVLARVAEEWHRAVGPYRPEVTLTCPATWGAARRTLLAEAAARAGLEGARLVAEPVAAATYFAEVLGRDVPIGSVVMVHDFGAGTFDTSVVARHATGFEVLAVDGRDDLGGLDVDAAIVEHLHTDDWARLMEPATVEERRARRQLWDDVRIAKERLSRAQSADFVVPLLDVEAHLTREELETVARPVLEQTVQITQNLLRWADLPEGRLAGVFLVGGASRIPLVATLLHRALGDPPVVIEQPELVVAEGSIMAGAALLSSEPAAPGPTEELRLPSKYLPASVIEDDRPTVLAAKPRVEDDRPTVLAAKPRVEDDRPTVLAAKPRVEDDRPTVLAAKPLVEDDRPTVLAAKPRVEDDRPTVVAPRPRLDDGATVVAAPAAPDGATAVVDRPAPLPATTPVPAIPSAQGPEADRPPTGDTAVAGDSADTPVAAATGGPEPEAAQAAPAAAGPLPKRPSRPDNVPPRPDGPPRQNQHQGRGPGPSRPQPPATDAPPHLRPPVDPWPHAASVTWRPDPDATVATSPPEYPNRTPVPPRQPGPAARPKRSQQPVVVHARPISPAVGSARPVSPPRVMATVPQQQPTPEPARVRRPRRRLRRLLQVLVSLMVMVTVPVVALILAYGYGSESSFEQDAIDVLRDLRDLLGL